MATIKDVAREAGVSKTLVSRYLNGQPGVGPESREKIEKAIAALNYRPNDLARSLVLGQTKTIGVLADDLASPFIQPLIEGLEKGADGEPYTLIYTASSGDSEKKERQLRYFTNGRVDGVIVYGSMVRDDALLRPLCESGFPAVLIENDLPCSCVPKVLVNNRKGAREATEYLLGLGRRDLLHIGGNRVRKITLDRAQGFIDALENAGISPEDRVIFPDFPQEPTLSPRRGPQGQQVYFDAGYAQMRRLLAAGRVPEGVFFATDLSALGAVRALEEAGFKVPEDVSVVGFDDEYIAAARLGMNPITSMRQPLMEEGYQAVRMLLSLLEGRPPENQWLDTTLIMRGSAAER